MDGVSSGASYEPLSIERLARLLGHADDARRWRLLAEFLEDYRWERRETRFDLVDTEPPSTGDERWDVLLAALAEHLAAQDGRAAPAWADVRQLRSFWFPFNSRAARVDAVVHAPAAFRRRGVYLSAQELGVA